MKKWIAFLLALTLLFALLPTAALPAHAEGYSGYCGTDVKWSLDSETGLLRITGSGAINDYSYGNAPWKSYRGEIRHLEVCDGVTSIGDGAFRDCKVLEDAVLAESVTAIGECAFLLCEGLRSVNIPKGVTVINYFTFGKCASLEQITIPDGVTSIGFSVFDGCASLKTVAIPAGVLEIKTAAFASCDSLTSITVAAGNPNYRSVDGVLFNKDKTVLLQYPGGKEGDYAIPNGVKTVGEHAFCGSTGLTGVSIPSSVKTLAYGAFSDCDALKSMTVPDTVTSVGENAFSECEALESVTLSKNQKIIARSLCTLCPSLQSVTIPNGIEEIEMYAFVSCKSLTGVSFPKSLKTIGDSAFLDCVKLKRVTVPKTVTTIDPYALGYCYSNNIDVVKLTDFVLYGEENSAGILYAERNGLAYVILGAGETPGSGPFLDVSEKSWYYDAVLWAYNNGITSGVDALHFCPNNPCTRAQVVQFLWTAAGKPLPEVQEPEPVPESTFDDISVPVTPYHHPFLDVFYNDWYNDAVGWAYENGITGGIDSEHFGPNNYCTRAQVVMFLWKACGTPRSTSTQNPFVDVADDAYYYNAVLWAVENGVTSGIDKTHFGPNNRCTRAQVVTFLFKVR